MKIFDEIAKKIVHAALDHMEIPDIVFRILRVQPGDTIILKSKNELSMRAYEHLEEEMKNIFPSYKNLVLAGELDLAVIRETSDDRMPQDSFVRPATRWWWING